MRPAEDPNHEGNSAKYHTGKPCTVAGCLDPAGTWWGKHWCQRHNAERLARIGGALEDAVSRGKFHEAVDGAVGRLRFMCDRLIAENRALIAAHGGNVTLTDEHYSAETASESVSYRHNRPHVIRYTYKSK